MKTHINTEKAINELVEEFQAEALLSGPPSQAVFETELYYKTGGSGQEDFASPLPCLYGEFLAKLALPVLGEANFNHGDNED